MPAIKTGNIFKFTLLSAFFLFCAVFLSGCVPVVVSINQQSTISPNTNITVRLKMMVTERGMNNVYGYAALMIPNGWDVVTSSYYIPMNYDYSTDETMVSSTDFEEAADLPAPPDGYHWYVSKSENMLSLSDNQIFYGNATLSVNSATSTYELHYWIGDSDNGWTSSSTESIVVRPDPCIDTTYTDGDADGYLDVATVCQLKNLVTNSTTAYYELTDDINFDTDNNQELLTGSGFSPIGTSASPFKGRLNGNNHTITGLYIYRPEVDYVGLFGYVTGGVINNINLVDVDVTGRGRVGGLVGRLYVGGTISGSSVTGNVAGEYYVGGLVGGAVGAITNSRTNVNVTTSFDFGGGLVGGTLSTISGSYSTGKVVALSYTDNNASVGGLVGVLDATGRINNCSSSVDVSGVWAAGGLAGSALGDITNSFATGNVTSTYDYAGGLVGSLSGNVSTTYATGKVYIYNGSAAGGLVGVSDNSSSGKGEIYDSYATGNVIGDNSGQWYGGLVGGTNAIVSNSFATGAITAPTSNKVGGLIGGTSGQVVMSSSTGNVLGGDYVGGLIGYINDNIVSSSWSFGSVEGLGYVGGLVGYNDDGTISVSYATGDVASVDNSYDHVGGLVGKNYHGVVENTYATGNVSGDDYVGGLIGENTTAIPVSVSNSYYAGNVYGVNYVGGLIGSNNGDDINNCFAASTINYGGDYVGGLIGYDESENANLYTNNYWYSNIVKGISNYGTNTSTDNWDWYSSASLFKNTSTTAPFFNHWDFNDIWETSLGNYPTLRMSSADNTVDLFDGGAGTTSSPYQISTCAQLENIATDAETMAAHYVLADNIDCSATANWHRATGFCSTVNKNYNTQAACESNDYTWTDSPFYKGFNPIGCGRADDLCWDRTEVSFTGVFDGNNKNISDLYINRREYYLGLFGHIGAGAEIKDLNIVNASISSGADISYVGVLSGFISSESAINNVNITGVLNAPSSTFVGGLGGYHDYQEECFLAGTPIFMQDGTHKNIESVQVGDMVVNYDEISNKKISGTVAKTFIHQVDHYLIINGNLKVTTNHPLYVNGKWLAAGNIHIGDTLMNENGQDVDVFSIVKIYEKVPVYNLEVNPGTDSESEVCGPGHSYFAGGVLAHNKCPVVATDDGTGYKFNSKINVSNIDKEQEKLFTYKMKPFTNGTVKLSYDPFDIDYVNYVAIEIIDSKDGKQVKHLLEPVSCSGKHVCDVSLLREIDDKYLVMDKNNTEVELNFGELPAVVKGHTRAFNIISSGYQTVLQQSHPFDYPDEINKWFYEYFDWFYAGAHHTISTSSAKLDIHGYDYVGGVAGYNAGDIRNSYSTSSVTGYSNVGGLVGYSAYGSNILGSYSTGNVYGNNNFIGGLVGANSGVTRNCYSTGNINAGNLYVGGFAGANSGDIYTSYATGNVIGTGSVGGFAGYNGSDSIYSSFSTAQSVAGSGDYVGGFIGDSSNSHANTGWVTIADMSAIGRESGESVATINYNTTSSAAFYPATHGVYTAGDNDWDFTNIWESHANHLPTLRSIAANAVSTTYVTITYLAGTGGTISGSSSQYIAVGVTGSEVTAVANSGYRFSKWSEDDSTSASRSDVASSDQAFTAVFVRSSGGSGTSVVLPSGIGSGTRDSSADNIGTVGVTLNIGEVTNTGVNVLTYINNTNQFSTPESSHNWNFGSHTFQITSLDLYNNIVTIVFSSTPQTVILKKGEKKELDLDGDQINDILVSFVNTYVNRAEITVQSLAKSMPTATSELVSSVVTKYVFKRNLKQGMKGNDVKQLQILLNKLGFTIATKGAGSAGKETTLFGAATKKALIKFQKKYNLKPYPGYVGPGTLKVLNSL